MTPRLCKQQRQEDGHHDAHYYLQRQSYFHIIGESVVSRVHDQRIGRGGEWRREAHTRPHRDGKQH